MIRLQFRTWTSLALVLAFAMAQTGKAQYPSSTPSGSYGSGSTSSGPANGTPSAYPYGTASSTYPSSTETSVRSYKVYSLDELGGDPSFGEWIVQTIPEVIATGTWTGSGVIRYYAPKNILVVSHTAAVQAEVDKFLKDVKKSLPEAKQANKAPHASSTYGSTVVPAAFNVPSVSKSSTPVAEASLSYPVPAQAKTPKHLFHFIIRYEGEGIVDDTVAKVIKGYYQMAAKANETQAAQPTRPVPDGPSTAASGLTSGGAPSSAPVAYSSSSPYCPGTVLDPIPGPMGPPTFMPPPLSQLNLTPTTGTCPGTPTSPPQTTAPSGKEGAKKDKK